MLSVLKEITEWKGTTPNHIYLIDGNKVLAFIREGTCEPIVLKQPMMFDKRYRKFVSLKDNPFNIQVKSNVTLIEGSRGAVYELDKINKTCTCPGFTFRGHCKHLK